jgi:hypothetical protein
MAGIVATGHAACTRCGRLIVPGSRWDLDHTEDRSGYLGPAHHSCNRRAGAIKGNQARGAAPMVMDAVEMARALAHVEFWMPQDLSEDWASSQPDLEVLRADVARLRHYSIENARALADA